MTNTTAPVGVEITDEAVEAAARKYFTDLGWDWDDIDDDLQDQADSKRTILRQFRRALEAAQPFMTSRTALDRGAVEQAIRDAHNGEALNWVVAATNAVMALAVPVPTHEALVEAISARLHITSDQIMTGGSPRQLVADTTAVHETATAVLALLKRGNDW